MYTLNENRKKHGFWHYLRMPDGSGWLVKPNDPDPGITIRREAVAMATAVPASKRWECRLEFDMVDEGLRCAPNGAPYKTHSSTWGESKDRLGFDEAIDQAMLKKAGQLAYWRFITSDPFRRLAYWTAHYDWYYHMSDDYSVWQAGERYEAWMKIVMKMACDIDEVKAIGVWNLNCPYEDYKKGDGMLRNVIVQVYAENSGIPESWRMAPVNPDCLDLRQHNRKPLFSVEAEWMWVGGVSTKGSRPLPLKVEKLPEIPAAIAETGRAVYLNGQWYPA